MKKLFIVFCLIMFVTGVAAAQLRAGGTMYVAVRNVDLKASTGFFARNTGWSLSHGDTVIVINISGRFAQVRNAANPSMVGWTPSANLSARQVVAGTGSTATAREVAMAGKGFNQDVEQSFRAQQNLNYDDVDRVEAITIDLEELRLFLIEGRLSLGDN